MEAPNKRPRPSSPAFKEQTDFVPLGGSAANDTAYGYGNASNPNFQPVPEHRGYHSNPARGGYHDRRDREDRPKSKHILPGYEPWVLVRTRLRRRFVHNTETKESFWHIPQDVMPGVVEFEEWEKDQKEKAENARWAEEQLKEMREKSKATEVNEAADKEGRGRRRRSESLQREDEAAMMAELAAQAEYDEEQDVKDAVQAVRTLQPQGFGYDSDGSYEEVEVTDSEGEEREDDGGTGNDTQVQDAEAEQPADDGPVEFGEDDIAWQLAQMGEDYGLDPGEYGDAEEEEWAEGAEGLPLTNDDAANLFRDLLDDYRISPFTPWDKIIADETDASIINDDRYTVLPNMRARKEVFDIWVKDKAAQIKEERAAMEKQDPRIPYLAFLHSKATPKLYWPEFKRKYKREAELNDRKLGDKDREKLYRDHINRLKLPESTRKADLQTLMKSLPLKALNRETRLEALPQQLLSHLHYVSLPAGTRDPIIEDHIRKLPPPPEDGDLSDEQRIEEEQRRDERRRREKALAERERKVEEERRRAEKDGARARRDLREEERELQRAMAVYNRGLKSHLLEGDAVTAKDSG
ncbi:unnamed protein product [Zymoseptoria tritici ST99CH_1A5]|uniref:FF domain-containing protein n=3 Tax=Zymoseptoria tritici TaxID=1047171 RepID=A0A1X7RQM4_ZYMT9|nr:unnamed protein product [Zymoseptoria tritici ST99CH_3D7]SMR50531.1 unnamed protein product [Zymoseptoria tritici ST99CH_1E4]SMY23231.1 unnamed protein product [Zymoseptoria tritici ST99CH_1A5]